MTGRCYDLRFLKISRILYLRSVTSGASNTGFEPYSEKYAYIIGKQLEFDVIPYKISKWKGNLCSACEIFTDIETAYIPVGRLVTTGGMKAVREFYEKLGEEFVRSLNEMIVFDALICNTDRHFGNFGVLIDSKNNRIIKPAPLFDHGNSLFSLAGSENWESEAQLDEYVKTLLPCVYDDFITEARKVMDASIAKKVRKALNLKIRDEGRYRYPAKQLALIEKQVQKRAGEILKG